MNSRISNTFALLVTASTRKSRIRCILPAVFALVPNLFHTSLAAAADSSYANLKECRAAATQFETQCQRDVNNACKDDIFPWGCRKVKHSLWCPDYDCNCRKKFCSELWGGCGMLGWLDEKWCDENDLPPGGTSSTANVAVSTTSSAVSFVSPPAVCD